MRVPSSTPAPGAKLVTLGLKPSSDWLLEHGFASECGMKPWYDCADCGAAGIGKACAAHRVPGIGVTRIPDPQEVAYIENVGHEPPLSDSPQWAWKKTKNGPTALEMVGITYDLGVAA